MRICEEKFTQTGRDLLDLAAGVRIMKNNLQSNALPNRTPDHAHPDHAGIGAIIACSPDPADKKLAAPTESVAQHPRALEPDADSLL